MKPSLKSFAVSFNDSLLKGEYQDFLSASFALLTAYNIEKDLSPEDLKEFWAGQINRVIRAIDLYAVFSINEAISHMRHEGLHEFAKAIEENDYSHLAY